VDAKEVAMRRYPEWFLVDYALGALGAELQVGLCGGAILGADVLYYLGPYPAAALVAVCFFFMVRRLARARGAIAGRGALSVSRASRPARRGGAQE